MQGKEEAEGKEKEDLEKDGNEVEPEGEEKVEEKRNKDGPGRYPLPCCTHFGNLKCAQHGVVKIVNC